MPNLRISVATTTSLLEEKTAVCKYRDGKPAVREVRPERFNCDTVLTGKFVQVRMVDAKFGEAMCIDEIQIVGTGKWKIYYIYR